MRTWDDRGRPKLVLGVYVVTAAGLVPGRGHAEVAVGAIEGGANAVQLHAPEHGDDDLLPLARELADRCGERGVLFILHERVELALASGAAGVHLGKVDPRAETGPPPWVVDPTSGPAGGIYGAGVHLGPVDPRAQSGPPPWVGRMSASRQVCNQVIHSGDCCPVHAARLRLGPEPVLGVTVDDRAQARAAEAAGADYLGVNLAAAGPGPSRNGLERLRDIGGATGLPVVGFGGIDPATARQAMQAGAAGVAAVSTVAAAPDPAAATRDLVAAVRGTTGAPPYRR